MFGFELSREQGNIIVRDLKNLLANIDDYTEAYNQEGINFIKQCIKQIENEPEHINKGFQKIY